MPKLTLYIQNEESKISYDWPVVPQIGEYVEPDGSGTYKVEKVVHVLRRKGKEHVTLVVTKEEAF